MPRLSRRSFLAASAAFAARPALAAAAPTAGPVDVVIVGAGAAGIAAARRIAAAGRRFVLLEAADHIGGRCITDTRTFGVPFDRGAHWIHMPDLNPLTKLAAAAAGSKSIRRRPSQKVRIGRRYAREGEMEDFLAAQVRANRAIADAARKGRLALRAGSAERSWRLAASRSNSCSARSVAARIWRRSRPSISPDRPSATSTRFAGRDLARCSPSSPRASRSSCRRR